MSLPSEIEGRWTAGVVLKRDLLSTVERGRFRTAAGEIDAVLRRIDEVPWWTFGVARHLFARERKALAIAGELGIAPPLLFSGRRALVRGWIDGLPLHIAKPRDDRGYLPLRQGRAAQAAPRRHLPQRSRQGAELAARTRRPRLSHRLPACRLLPAPDAAVPHRGLRRSAAPAQAQAALCVRRPHRRRAPRAREQEPA